MLLYTQFTFFDWEKATLIRLTLCTMFMGALLLLSMSARAESEEMVPVISETLSVKSKVALVDINVGTSKRLVQLSRDGKRAYIRMSMEIKVSAFLMSYRRNLVSSAWFDVNGLTRFATEIDENGKLTQLCGERSSGAGGTRMSITGIIDGEVVDKSISFDSFRYTNLENFAYVAALARRQVNYPILDLFTGKVNVTTVTPYGRETCAKPVMDSCFKVMVESPENNGTFYYASDGWLVSASGEDTKGSYILQATEAGNLPEPEFLNDEENPEKQQEGEPSLIQRLFGFFGTPKDLISAGEMEAGSETSTN